MRALRLGLHRRRHPLRYAWLARLLAQQQLDADALAAHQRQALHDLVRHAASHVPYYRARLPAPGAWDGALHTLPVLSKDAVRAHLRALLSDQADPAATAIGHTGGSTGQPLAFWYDQAKHELMRAGMMRGFMMSGWRPGQKVLYLWGARQDVGRQGVFGTGLADLIAGERTVAALAYSPARLSAWAALIRRWRPVLLYGYASALAELARHVLERGLAMPASLIGVYATAEMLHPEPRSLMQQAFGCRVYNQYGCREVPNIAWECQHGGMHVMSDLVLLESQRQAEGERLLVTSLTNRLMPFIRYDLGDHGRLLPGACTCGAPFPLLEMGVCRDNDLIRTPDGRRIHPAVFNRMLYGLGQIRQYQWVQTGALRMRLDLVCGAPLEPGAQAGVEAALRRDVHPAMTLELRYVASIARTPAGKQRYIIALD